MKVKDFLEWFSDIDPESELRFDLSEDERMPNGDFEEMITKLDMVDITYLDIDDTVFVTFSY